ncbi:MAG: DEAD/DEAH box helicase [Rhodothermales bacterium]
MSSDEKQSSRYTEVIDLTRRAQRERRQEQDVEAMRDEEAQRPAVSQEDLPDSVQAALSAAGWDTLMPVQQKVIPYMLDRKDLVVQSRTGSGKTGAFLLPLFELLDSSRDETQALIMTPTRELAKQINSEFERMKLATPETNEMRSVLVYGGVAYGPQIEGLKGGAHVVIGTPGRILDHLSKGNADLDRLKFLIFDEADEMLSMGFYPDMKELRRYLPDDRHTYMFSATIPPKVRTLSRDFLTDPQFISLSAGQESVETLEYRYYVTDPMEKDRVLARLFELENPDAAIVFVNTKREVEYLTKFLQNYGYSADAISGDLSQKAREEALDRAHSGETRFLIATDVAARGIDISDLSHVFMYDVPQDPEYLVHRSGRTARAGKIGVAIVLATFEDETDLIRAASRYGISVEKRPLPTAEDVSNRISERLTVILENRMRDRSKMERERAKQFVPLVQDLAREEPELLAMFIDDVREQDLHASKQAQMAAQAAPDEEEAHQASDRDAD